jgi:precorrin-2 dehydrogenase/sirohydrochlorin ferrochelatase
VTKEGSGFYPVVLRLRDRRVLVVGGGKVGARRAAGLLEAGAHVVVVSPRFAPAFARLVDTAALTLIERSYVTSDLTGVALVVAATDDPTVNARVRADVRRAGLFVCVVDDPEWSDFLVPAVVRRGDLLVAISTSGRSPALAGQLRRELDLLVPDDWEVLVRLLGLARARVQAAVENPARRQELMKRLITLDLLSMLRNGGDGAAADRIQALIAELVASPTTREEPATGAGTPSQAEQGGSLRSDTQTPMQPKNDNHRSAPSFPH